VRRNTDARFDATYDEAILCAELQMPIESLLKFGAGNVKLNPSPIRPDWILEGNPVARNRVLSSSRDGSASTLIWDCTAGKFNWFYSIDETVYVIEGSVIVKDPSGITRRVLAGETIFFPAGSQAEWTVEEYIRKVAFCRSPLPRALVFAKRGYRFLKRMAKPRTSMEEAPAMFLGS
jgi:uncharacterized cupin superfamily protein